MPSKDANPQQRPSPRSQETPLGSLLSQFLPPDPKAPTRPTIPPPTCGTLPPVVSSVVDLLGGLGRFGR
jgi:hypothetical protein